MAGTAENADAETGGHLAFLDDLKPFGGAWENPVLVNDLPEPPDIVSVKPHPPQLLFNMRQALFVVLQLQGVLARDIDLGVGVLANEPRQPVMIDMAMGDEDMLQPPHIDRPLQKFLPLPRRRTSVEQRQFAGDFRGVKMRLPHHVGSMYGVLLHQ
jgi:hypothetical protein